MFALKSEAYYSPPVTLRPQVKMLRLDLGIQLGQSTHEALQNLPRSLCGRIRRIYSVSIIL